MGDPISTYQAIPQTGKASDLLQSFSNMMGSVGKVVSDQEQQYENIIIGLRATQQQEYSNIVQAGRRKELIAILNAMYECGIAGNGISKAEWFERMAVACGDAGLKDYASPLHQIMNTYKYDGIFTELGEAAKRFQANSDKK